jgi:predicted acetyltransferase
LPDVVKSNKAKQGEKYTTFLNLQSEGYTGTFEDYLKSTEVIKPEKVPKKYFWAVDKDNRK